MVFDAVSEQFTNDVVDPENASTNYFIESAPKQPLSIKVYNDDGKFESRCNHLGIAGIEKVSIFTWWAKINSTEKPFGSKENFPYLRKMQEGGKRIF
jgi:hypothetical protein